MVEEVADVTLGALIQVLEVGGELDCGVSAEMRKWSEVDLRCSIKNGVLPKAWAERRRSAGGTFAGTLVASHLLRRRRRG